MNNVVKHVIAPVSLAILIGAAAPLSAQSLSDAIGPQVHTFAPSSLGTPPSQPLAKWTRHASQPSQWKRDLAERKAQLARLKWKERRAARLAAADKSDASTAQTAQPAAQQTVAATTKPAHKLTAAQIAKHRAHLLALRAAHRRAHHSALNGFDQTAGKQAEPLDSLTRDGSVQTNSSSAGSRDMSIGAAVGRAIAALAIVLGLAYGAITFLRKRGIGLPSGAAETDEIDQSPFGLRLHTAGSGALDQFHKAVAQAQSRQGAETPPTGIQNIGKAIDGLEVLGSQELPGTAHTLYKVKVGDRILLLGGSLSGALTALTEWDVETKPETEQHFESVLNQMTMSVAQPTPPVAPPATAHLGGGSQADALRTATQRLSRSARRMAEAGRAANDGS